MYNYQFKDPKVQRLIDQALKETWDPYRDLPWTTPVSREQLTEKNRSLLEELPEFKAMTKAQQEDFKFKEGIYHICNLLAGEHKGVSIAGQILLGCPQETPDWPYFVSTILGDERNHVIALHTYLDQKAGLCYAPHPRIAGVLDALLKDGPYEIKLFIGQVVLEWTATSLLTSMVSKRPEPLFKGILHKIIRDEGRHLAFNRIVFSQLDEHRFDLLRRTTEDLLFESIVACVSSLCAIPVWKEFGFSLESCRKFALKEMEDRGVIRFYRDILPKELKRCNFYSDRLTELLNKELPKRIITDHWSYQPELIKIEPLVKVVA